MKTSESTLMPTFQKNDHSSDSVEDQLFFFVFYASLGFLLTFVGLFGRSAFQIPFFVLCFVVSLRIIMRPELRQSLYRQLHSRHCIFIAVLVFSLLSYALVGVWDDASRLRLFGKPAVIAIGLMLLAFIWSYRNQVDNEKVTRGLIVGLVSGLICVCLISAWQSVVKSGAGSLDLSSALKITIYALNDELKILSVLVFFAVVGLTSPLKRNGLAAILCIAIFVMSYFTMGLHKSASGLGPIVHVPSETVQFGIPIALMVLLLAHFAPQFMTNLVFFGVSSVLVTAPWLFQVWYQWAEQLNLPKAGKFLVRAEIWDAAGRASLSTPFLGHGLDATRYGLNLDIGLKYYKTTEVWHPHNMFVQIWLDMGLIGVILALCIIYLGWLGVCKISVDKRAPLLAGIVMYILFALVTHSVWQTWSMILLIMMFTLGSLFIDSESSEKKSI